MDEDIGVNMDVDILSSAEDVEAIMNFKNMKQFKYEVLTEQAEGNNTERPQLSNNIIKTRNFLEAAESIVEELKNFRDCFKPVIDDMLKNIGILKAAFEKNEDKLENLFDLILNNEDDLDKKNACYLTWLQRSLDLIQKLFENSINSIDENSYQCFQKAYDKTLKKYHPKALQDMVMFWAENHLPSRQLLFGSGDHYNENAEFLGTYLPDMKKVLIEIKTFLNKNKIIIYKLFPGTDFICPEKVVNPGCKKHSFSIEDWKNWEDKENLFRVPGELSIYTDGSENENLGFVGSGIFCKELDLKRSYKLPSYSSSTQAEWFALKKAAEILLELNITDRDITFYIDCASVIEQCTTDELIISLLTKDTRKILAELSNQNNRLILCWIKSHMRHPIPGNEEADKLAKAGAESKDPPIEELCVPNGHRIGYIYKKLPIGCCRYCRKEKVDQNIPCECKNSGLAAVYKFGKRF